MMGLYLGSVALVAGLASRRFLAGPNAPHSSTSRRPEIRLAISPSFQMNPPMESASRPPPMAMAWKA